MAAKKQPKKTTGQGAEGPLIGPSPFDPTSFDPRSMQKYMSDLTRLLNSQEFSSEEEMNEFLRNVSASGQLPTLPPSSPLEEAQDVMFDAWEASSRAKRVNLAKKALAISPDCADAYVLLAEETAKSPEEALHLYAEGMAAGERAIGPEGFKEMEGHFWGVLETRPYMRAREGYAYVLWHLGQVDKVITHFQDMLRLNPNDNQGVRYHLLQLYQETGDDEALGTLIKQYKTEYSANWFYTEALLLFRQQGAGKRATKKLKEALAQNPHVPNYLLGLKKLPKRTPDFIGNGDMNEAIVYVSAAMPFWLHTPGAIDWLRKVAESVGE